MHSNQNRVASNRASLPPPSTKVSSGQKRPQPAPRRSEMFSKDLALTPRQQEENDMAMAIKLSLQESRSPPLPKVSFCAAMT